MRLSLLVKLVLTLGATGLLPLTISFYQLRVNKDALLEQLQVTHSVVARTTAERVRAFVEPLEGLARTLAQTAYHQSANSGALQELLRGALQVHDVGVEIFNARGEEVIRAQRPSGVWDELDLAYDAEAPALGVVREGDGRWLRLVERLPEDAGQVVLAGRFDDLAAAISAREIGEEAVLVLADLDGAVVFGSAAELAAFPRQAVDLALSGRLRSGSEKYLGPESAEDLVVAFARVEGTPWVVLSRQPARQAEIAQEKIRDASWLAAAGTLLLVGALSSLAHATVIRPLRRLIRAQRNLAGAAGAARGSEIAQLEEAFAVLEQRLRDREDLGKVFLGRYQVVEVLGSGAMGTVFKGWDPKLERPLALKTIRLESEDLRREKLMSTLLREAKTSAGFNHPNIVTVYDAADEGKAAFIAMELVEGVSLEHRITEARLGWRRAVPLGAAIARGLAAAHARQLVHQDVKPANVLLGRDGAVKVTDFGISQAITSASAAEGVICGTPGYIAPECLEGAAPSPKSDLFAFGVLLYECLTGRHPFAGKTLRHTLLNTISVVPAPLDDLEADLPRALARLVFELLDKDPDRRPADAETVAAKLEEIAREHGLAWSFVEPRVAAPRRGERPRTQILSVRSTRALAMTVRRMSDTTPGEER